MTWTRLFSNWRFGCFCLKRRDIHSIFDVVFLVLDCFGVLVCFLIKHVFNGCLGGFLWILLKHAFRYVVA